MEFDTAKALVDQHAPDLACQMGSSAHVNIWRAKDGKPTGAPFSIMLPKSTDAMPQTPEQMVETFLNSLKTAGEYL